MMSDVIEVEVNLMASGKVKHYFDRNGKKPQGDVQPYTSQLSDENFDFMMKNMEKLMERMSMEKNPTNTKQNDF